MEPFIRGPVLAFADALRQAAANQESQALQRLGAAAAAKAAAPAARAVARTAAPAVAAGANAVLPLIGAAGAALMAIGARGARAGHAVVQAVPRVAVVTSESTNAAITSLLGSQKAVSVSAFFAVLFAAMYALVPDVKAYATRVVDAIPTREDIMAKLPKIQIPSREDIMAKIPKPKPRPAVEKKAKPPKPIKEDSSVAREKAQREIERLNKKLMDVIADETQAMNQLSELKKTNGRVAASTTKFSDAIEKLTNKDLDGDGQLAGRATNQVKKKTDLEERLEALRSKQGQIDEQIKEKRRQLRELPL